MIKESLDNDYRLASIAYTWPGASRGRSQRAWTILMISRISVEQVIDHAATTPESVERSFSSAGRRPAHLPALAGCPAYVGQIGPLAILILFAGLDGCDA